MSAKTIGDEIRIYLNLEEYDIKDSFSKKDKEVPLPYIVTIDNLSKEVLSIKRDWTENDKSQTRKKDFIQYYGLVVDVNEEIKERNVLFSRIKEYEKD